MKFSIQKGDRFWKSTPQYKKIVIEYVGLSGINGVKYLLFNTVEVVRNPVITNSSKWWVGLRYNVQKETLLNTWERIPSKSEQFKTIYDILNAD